MFGAFQYLVLVVLAVAVFAVQLAALIDALRRPAGAFTAEGKLTKPIWLAILGAAAAIGLLGLPPLMLTSTSFFNVLAVAPAVIYWVDVRPRVKPYGSGGGSGPRRPSGW